MAQAHGNWQEVNETLPVSTFNTYLLLGHLEFGESFEECARRETLEETNLDIGTPTYLTTTNDIMAGESKHYVTVFMHTRIDRIDALKVMEPDKIQGTWQWVTWPELANRTPLFLPLARLVRLIEQDVDLQKKLGILD
jgi:8-oxo-dGTP diphosphatase